ncbi:MAG: 50S ribosomal protein L5 [Planctomycetota bacterium]
MVATANSNRPRFQAQLEDEVWPAVREKFNISNPMALPRIEKIVINVGMGKQLENNKLKAEVRDTVLGTLSTISGQKPIMIAAKRSVSNFKVREGALASAKVTLRRDRMWSFLDRMIHLAIPRVKDFRGLPDKSFDKGGSYAFGFTEQAVWPEIDMGRVNFIHGMHINVVFKNSTPEISKFVLEQLGFPFVRRDEDTK